MTDEAYTLAETNKDRKSTARSAKGRVNGSKSKTCRLSTDHMTTAQLNKLNGEVISMNPTKPMTYKDLLALPLHLQKEYISIVVKNHKPTTGELGQMLGVSQPWAAKYVKALGVELITGRGNREEHRADWAAFISGKTEDAKAEIRAEEPKPEDVILEYLKGIEVTGGSITLVGKPTQIFTYFIMLAKSQKLDESSKTITITWR